MMTFFTLIGMSIAGNLVSLAIMFTVLYWLDALSPLGLSPYAPKYARTFTGATIYIVEVPEEWDAKNNRSVDVP